MTTETLCAICFLFGMILGGGIAIIIAVNTTIKWDAFDEGWKAASKVHTDSEKWFKAGYLSCMTAIKEYADDALNDFRIEDGGRE